MVDTFNPNKVDITITESALKHFSEYLNLHPEAKALRFTVKKAGCSGYKYISELIDKTLDNDLHIQNPLNLNLVVEQPNLVYLNGMIIDYISQGLGQSKVVFINPNETGKCGCGESFSV
jgi:iron-sulfur cluster assembly accessory protein